MIHPDEATRRRDETERPSPETGAPEFQVTVHSDLVELATVWPAMSGMEGCLGYAFQARDLLETWCSTIGAARRTQACFIRVALGEEPLMLIPLGIERRFGIRILSFLDGGVADYNAPVMLSSRVDLDRPQTAVLWRQICAALPQFDVAILDKVPSDIGAMQNPFRWIATYRADVSGHELALTGTWKDYAAKRLPRRQDSRRKRRRLNEVGPVCLDIAGGRDEVESAYQVIVRQKTRRYVETRGVNGFNRPGYRSYFRAMTDRFAESGEVQIATLLAGDTVVAANWGLVAGRRLYFLLPTFEAGEWQRFSPGRLMIEDLICWCYENGVEVFDFGVGDEAYKDEFRAAAVPLFRADIANTRRGAAYLRMRALRRVLVKTKAVQAVKRLRARLRGLLGEMWKPRNG